MKNHSKKVEDLTTNRGKVYMLIMGQCTQRLQDKLKQDILWATVDTTPKNPIELMNLIERVVLKQSETDQYPWATLHDADMAIKNLRQGHLTDHQWVERMRTRWEIAKSVGVERFCTVWVDYCARKKHSTDYDTLTPDQQSLIRDEAEERYIAYLIVLNSGSQHEHLRMSLQEDFAKKIDNYPKTIQEAETYLDKFPKKTPPATASEGTAFAQKGQKASGGKDAKSSDKSQDEHNCLAFALKSLIELSEAGGIRTVVMGKDVHVKPFIHYFIGDTEGLNKWLGHYNGSKPGVSRPYRDCHYNFIGMNASNPSCVYTTASEFRRAMRLVVRNRKDGMKMLKSMSRHCVNNALYQSRLPLSDKEHGANKMCPPEVLHTMDAGLTMYMLESLQRLVGEGLCRDLLDKQHVIMFYRMKRQSEQDTPRGSVRNGLIDTTRCQSSERKGNFFLLMCIAHTTAGSALLKDKLGHNNR